eukprot:1127756_1
MSADDPTKPKTKLSAEEIRQRRKKKAAARRKRILAGGTTRLEYVQNRVSFDKLHEVEESNIGNDTSAIAPSPCGSSTPFMSTADDTANPFMSSNGANDMFDGMPSNPFLSAMGSNPDVNEMMSSMLNAFGGNLTTNQESSEQQLARQKHEQTIERYDCYLHTLFCVLFALILVFLPYEYDVSILNYSLSSDAWTFFMGIEIILFTMFYGYKQYLQRKYDEIETQRVWFCFMWLLVISLHCLCYRWMECMKEDNCCLC